MYDGRIFTFTKERFVIEIPFIMGVFDEGGPVGTVEDIGLFLVGLAIYTTQRQETAVALGTS
jgi:hypothetical protein